MLASCVPLSYPVPLALCALVPILRVVCMCDVGLDFANCDHRFSLSRMRRRHVGTGRAGLTWVEPSIS